MSRWFVPPVVVPAFLLILIAGYGAVDLAGAPEGQQSLVILSTAGTRLDDAKRPDLLRLAFPNAVLTPPHRSRLSLSKTERHSHIGAKLRV